MSFLKKFLFSTAVFTYLQGISAAPQARAISQISQSAWDTLNDTVGGRLNIGYPMAKPCYSKWKGQYSEPDEAACLEVQEMSETDTFIASNYGGFQNSNWGTCQKNATGCNLDFIDPANPLVYLLDQNCDQGSVSDYYIEVQSAEDAAAGMEFAQENGIPISIKNSGHDYKGRSSAPGSLALWTNKLKPAINLTKDFVPDGCDGPVGDGVTFGAGENFDNLYQFAEANNITIVGGSSKTVGAAGGWITGAGHSSLSNTLGLGVDNVLQLKTVLPNGTYVTANRCQNQDIFWALRGGGGSTFGVNIEMTTRANPQVTLQVAYVRFLSLDVLSINKFITICVQNANKWSSEGWGGYIEPGAESILSSGFILATPLLSYEEAVASMKPMTDYVASLGNIALNNEVNTETSFYQYFEKYLIPNQEKVGISTAIGSRLIPRDNFETAEKQNELIDTLLNISALTTFPLTSGGLLDLPLLAYGAPLQFLVTAPSSYPGSGNDSSITPAWQDAVWHVFVNNPFSNQASTDTISEAFQNAHTAAGMLEAITPGSGAYQNEADTFERDPIGSFWGQENYDKLVEIKKAVDPGNILTCHHCVGWDSGDSRYACYPDAPSD